MTETEFNINHFRRLLDYISVDLVNTKSARKLMSILTNISLELSHSPNLILIYLFEILVRTMEEAAKDNDELSAAVGELADEVGRVNGDKAVLQEQVAELQAKVTELEAVNASLGAKNGTLQAKVAELQALGDKLRQELTDSIAQNVALDKRNDALHERNVELAGVQELNKTLHVELAHARARAAAPAAEPPTEPPPPAAAPPSTVPELVGILYNRF